MFSEFQAIIILETDFSSFPALQRKTSPEQHW